MRVELECYLVNLKINLIMENTLELMKNARFLTNTRKQTVFGKTLHKAEMIEPALDFKGNILPEHVAIYCDPQYRLYVLAQINPNSEFGRQLVHDMKTQVGVKSESELKMLLKSVLNILEQYGKPGENENQELV